MPAERVLVLYNEPVLPADHPDFASEDEIRATTSSVSRILTEAGYTVQQLGIGREPDVLCTALRHDRPDVVFNLFEGLATSPHTEATVVGLLEWLELPFTGSPSAALSLALDKYRTKQLLRGAGQPTPGFFSVEQLPCPSCPLHWPVIVKPDQQDASVGIDQASVVTSQEQLASRVALVLQRFGPPVLVEEFVAGREFHVHLVEDLEPAGRRTSPCVLPLAEIVFADQGPGYWPIYSYDAKWAKSSREYRETELESPVTLPPEPLRRLVEIAGAAYELIGCRDYGRLDVRMTDDGQFFILEVNPNPFLNSKAVVNGLQALGRSHTQFFLDRVQLALSRRG